MEVEERTGKYYLAEVVFFLSQSHIERDHQIVFYHFHDRYLQHNLLTIKSTPMHCKSRSLQPIGDFGSNGVRPRTVTIWSIVIANASIVRKVLLSNLIAVSLASSSSALCFLSWCFLPRSFVCFFVMFWFAFFVRCEFLSESYSPWVQCFKWDFTCQKLAFAWVAVGQPAAKYLRNGLCRHQIGRVSRQFLLIAQVM